MDKKKEKIIMILKRKYSDSDIEFLGNLTDFELVWEEAQKDLLKELDKSAT